MSGRRIEFSVEIDPATGRVNASLIPGKQGRFVGSGAAKDFKATVGAVAAMEAKRVGWETLCGPVEVFIRCFNRSWRLDTDAPVKAILDALQMPARGREYGAGLYVSDNRVLPYHVDRRVDAARPRIAIAVQEVELEPGVEIPDSWRRPPEPKQSALARHEQEMRNRKDLLRCASPARRGEVLTGRLVSSTRSYR